MNVNKEAHVGKICTLEPWDCPTHDYQASHLLRVGDRVFFSTAQRLTDREGMCNVYPMLYEKRGDEGWKLVWSDENAYQMDAGHLLYPGNDRLVMTLNPPKARYPKEQRTFLVPCTPVAYLFDISDGVKLIDIREIPWDKPDYPFRSHSYRSSCVDIVNGNLFFTNIHYPEEKHVYALTNAGLQPVRAGALEFPERGCYHNIAMKNGELYLFAMQDIVEPNEEWYRYKRQRYDENNMGFDYVFRTVYLNYSPDLTKEELRPSVEICSMADTCGTIDNLDCRYAANGDMVFMAHERNVSGEYIRDRFFPGVPMVSELCLYRLFGGEVKERVVIDRAEEGGEWNLSYNGFIHTAANGELYFVWARVKPAENGLSRMAFFIKKIDEPRQKPYKILERTGKFSYRVFGNKANHGAQADDRVEIYWTEGELDCMYACFDLHDIG